MNNAPVASPYLYITFLISTLYFVAGLAARNENEKIKIGRLVNYSVLNSFYTHLVEQLTPEQLTELREIANEEFTFQNLNEFFSSHLGEESLLGFSLDVLESEFRGAVKAALETLKGEARDQFKKELFKEYDKYRLSDL